MNPALHHDALTLPPAHSHLKLLPPRASPHSQYSHYGQPPGPYSIARSNHEPPDHFEVSPSKRKRLTGSEPAGGITDSASQRQPLPAMEAKHSIGFDMGPRGSEYPRGRPRGDSIEGRASTATPISVAPVVSKSRRVRTGCLTCRERHLKCDEGLPECNNCRKSNRECKRGVRLNFIDVQVKNPPYMPPTPLEWSVSFEDESRTIASEYKGGLGKYPRLDTKAITPPREPEPDATQHQSTASSREPTAGPREGYHGGTASMAPTPGSTGYDDYQPAQASCLSSRKDSGPIPTAQTPASQAGPSPIIGPASGNFSLNMLNEQYAREDTGPRNNVYRGSDDSSAASSLVPQGPGPRSQDLRPSALGPVGQPRGTPDGLMTPPSERAAGERDYLSDEEEIRFMQVFIDEVAIWMDTLDKEKHFTNVTPYLALKSSMMLNAFLACGAKHLTLVESYNDEKALYYYDTATTQLLRSLQNPDRDMTECAATAVVLNVYEIMSEKPTQRMNHIAGARALIRECGWNATTPGIGGACFWLNVGMEVLSCLHFNWLIAWDPDQWGLDLSFTNLTPSNASDANSQRGGSGIESAIVVTGDEETWAHRMFYIVAKIVNFRASIPRFQEPSPHDEQMRLQSRFAEWKRLKALCDAWNNNCPRTMQSYGYSHSPSTKSLFPNIWLIKRPAVIGRLFYHTAMCVLAQINPTNPHDSKENRAAQLHHAHQVCGIVAHTRDRGVASVAIRSLATSSSVLTDRQEQNEVLDILDKISKETGWRLGRIFAQLKVDWGWEAQGMPFSAGNPGNQLHHHPGPQHQQQQMSPFPTTTASIMSSITTATTSSASTATTISAPTPMRPLINPLLVNADFGNRNHPYKNWYEPPNRSHKELVSRSASRNGGGGASGGPSSGLLSWASATGSS